MKNTKSVLVSAALTSCLLMNATIGANANGIANFYNGKQVKIVVAARAGGGHHKYSLFISPFMKKHMPGPSDTWPF